MKKWAVKCTAAQTVARGMLVPTAPLRAMAIPLLFLLLLMIVGVIVERIKPGVLSGVFGAIFEV